MEERDEKSSRECDSDNVGGRGAEIRLWRSEAILHDGRGRSCRIEDRDAKAM